MSGGLYDTIIKPINVTSVNPINVRECKALSHPSNNSVFLIDGP